MPVRNIPIKALAPLTQVLVFTTLIFATVQAQGFEYVEESGLSDQASIADAIQKGNATLDFRLRYEGAQQSTPPKQGGEAVTLRSRLSFQTQRYKLFSAFLQFDDVSAIPDDNNYNSGSNGQLDDVLIGEPENTSISEAWLNYDIANTSITYGRQSFTLNSGRLMGNDDWYQNEQVFTGLSIRNQSLNYLTFSFADFNRIEQAYSKNATQADASLNAKLFDIHYRGFWLNDFSIYHLAITDHGRDSRWNTRTTGIFFSGVAGGNNGVVDSIGDPEGEDFSMSYLFEYAQQSDAGNNPVNYQADYRRIEVSAGYQGASLTIGQEVLGADGMASFVTPLGSVHAFQGSSGQAVDQAIGNHIGGVVDNKLQVSYRCSSQFSFGLAHHDYKYDRTPGSSSAIGSEFEASLNFTLASYNILAKFANYSADQVGEDTRRIWLQAGANF